MVICTELYEIEFCSNLFLYRRHTEGRQDQLALFQIVSNRLTKKL